MCFTCFIFEAELYEDHTYYTELFSKAVEFLSPKSRRNKLIRGLVPVLESLNDEIDEVTLMVEYINLKDGL